VRIDNFKAKQGSGKTLSVTNASQNTVTSGGQALFVNNGSANDIYFHFNTDNSVATAALTDGNWSFVSRAGTVQIFDIPQTITNIA
jgi:hypothetical protein